MGSHDILTECLEKKTLFTRNKRPNINTFISYPVKACEGKEALRGKIERNGDTHLLHFTVQGINTL